MSELFEQKKLLAKVYLKCILVVETGLHIGGAEGSLDIGGINKLVVREPITQHPYLPGSSIKGKLRAILERFLNKPLNRESGGVWRYESDHVLDGLTEIGGNSGQTAKYISFDGAATCELSRLFGSTGKDCWIRASDVQSGDLTKKLLKKGRQATEEDSGDLYKRIKGENAPARLIIRDAHLQEASIKQLKKVDTGLFMTERKFENGIDRITAAANPRQIERVPKGAKFELEIVYSIEKTEDVIKDLENLVIALAILEDDALGGHGSRGYGKVKFEEFQLFYHDYSKMIGDAKNFIHSIAKPKNINELLGLFDEKDNKIKKALDGILQKSETQNNSKSQ